MNNKNKRLAFILSGGIDALVGAAILLLGFGFFPIDVTQYGFQTWHAILPGGIMFLFGVGTLVYNLSRLEE